MTDDTAAIQRAMLSGKPVVCFPKTEYIVNGTIDIPASVKEINGLHIALYRSVASAAWILGFKSENASRLFLADDHTRLEVLGGTNYNWMPLEGPAIVSRASRVSVLYDSQVSVVSGTWAQPATGANEIPVPRSAPLPIPIPGTILQEETDGNVRTLLATQVKRSGSKEQRINGTFIAICPHVDIK